MARYNESAQHLSPCGGHFYLAFGQAIIALGKKQAVVGMDMDYEQNAVKLLNFIVQ
jgi:hypothetical protein